MQQGLEAQIFSTYLFPCSTRSREKYQLVWMMNKNSQAYTEFEFNGWFQRQTSNERTICTAVWDIQGSSEHLLLHDSKIMSRCNKSTAGGTGCRVHPSGRYSCTTMLQTAGYLFRLIAVVRFSLRHSCPPNSADYRSRIRRRR